ncbi:aminotransferase class V-fold PLP-dependent enzyme [Oligoflexus tunisiensis]|uniref:aminotransferase class V-fold PLP-dependent enzyme n=1 Tax=Oligoflexus tunisiensis TaxID=708132 RepID=UPI000AD6369B|nr:SufS family cysteine desulfurase [Oligoflexus tunisiensis]
MRAEFPIFAAHPGLVYLDSAATSQKPQIVIDRMNRYYGAENANVHRGVYELSESATRAFEGARELVATAINAALTETIFTRGTTEAINLVAQSLGQLVLQPGDEILLTIAEHHSNIVPWQIVADRHGAKVRFIPLNKDRRLDMQAAAHLVNPRTKIIAFAHISNVLGIEHPVRELVALAKSVGALTVIDGAQGIAHLPVDVKALDCDFYAFSGHKVFGPTGIGVLYGRQSLLERMPPYQGGGDMIERVSVTGSTWNVLPSKFEAGTPNIAGAVGLGAAFEFVKTLDQGRILAHDRSLGMTLVDELKRHFPKVQLMIEPGPDWIGLVTLAHASIHPHDLAAICDSEQVCIRAGHHCAQPLMELFGVPATARVAPFLYNDENDIDRFVAALHKAEKLFA